MRLNFQNIFIIDQLSLNIILLQDHLSIVFGVVWSGLGIGAILLIIDLIGVELVWFLVSLVAVAAVQAGEAGVWVLCFF